MARDLDISLNLRNLPPRASVGKSAPTTEQQGQERVRKTLGDPPPPPVDLKVYPDRLRKLFSYRGVLNMLKRKLNALTGEDYSLAPAAGDRVCIDENGVVFIGMQFLESHIDDEALLAGVLAHEWGHFPTRRKKQNLDHMSWDEVYRLRREEETKADMFCGRALFLLNYKVESLVSYLRKHDNPKDKSKKYHSVESREKVIRESYASQSKRSGMAHKFKMPDAVYGDPIHGSKLIGS